MPLRDLNNFKELAKQGNIIPVYRELLADMETPLGIYARLANCPHSFLLESVEGGEKLARYSFIGFDPREVFSSKGNEVTIQTNGKTETFTAEKSPVEELKLRMKKYRSVHVEGLPRFSGGAVGYSVMIP